MEKRNCNIKDFLDMSTMCTMVHQSCRLCEVFVHQKNFLITKKFNKALLIEINGPKKDVLGCDVFILL